jgi:parvulin-like peptidyl-prolyl isomerase
MFIQIENGMVSSSYSSIQPDEIVGYLKKNLQFKEVCQAILTQKIIAQTALEREIVVSSEEIQAEADRLRRDLRLERATDTLAWLSEQQITVEDWEAGICDRLLTQKLKETLFGKQVESFFAQNRLNFEQVILYQILVPYEHVAREVFYQTEEREISFYEAAHLYDMDSKRRYQCGYEGAVYRWNLKPEIAAAAFGATPGEVVRPVQTDQGFHLLLVEEFLPAQLTAEIREEILSTLFREWLSGELNHWLNQ